MSGTPTEAEIQTQWRNAVDVLESLRSTFDGTIAGAGGKLDTLLQSLEGEYLPGELARFATAIRSGCSALVTPQSAFTALQPIMFDYANILKADASGGFGSGYRNAADIFRALYEWFHDNTLTVESRAITFDTTPTAGGSNVGNGALSRLTVDEHDYDMEACHVEKKQLRCRGDQNSGAFENAEVFEISGVAASFDSLLRASFGSGDAARRTLTSKHAGTGEGGSLLQNSSFSTYNASGTPKFAGWTEDAGGANISQDTTNYYRSFPNARTDASLKITGGSGTVTLSQPLTAMQVRRLDPNTPYFLRVMVNPTVGTASGGTFTIKLGSQTVNTTVASMSSGWQEILVPIGTGCWFRNFNEDPFDIEIEWSSSSSGYLLVDDMIFCPWDLVDGTFWLLRGNAASHTPWLVDDILTVTDTGGAPSTGKVQWWNFVSGLGYLPSSGTPTFADP